jgi:flagellar basal-body rod modification protein FlgD
MPTSAVNGAGGAAQQASTTTDAFAKLDMKEFLSLFIAELQNQDPLNPMDNQAMIEQISQIREIETNDRLNNTLQTVLLGQNMSTAAGLLGHTITGLSETNETITGRVDRVSVVGGTPKLHVGSQTVKLTNVSGINVGES